MDWKTLAAEKKSQLEASIPPEWRIKTLPTDDSVMSFPGRSGILTLEELNITESSATELVQDLASGKLSSVAVTTAFCKRGALAQQLTNCCHEFFPELALARAQYLDDYLTEHKEPIGPLHGLPISVKDQVRIKGIETTMGYVSWIGKKDTEDSVLTTMLLGAGAVLYVKTSVPQSLMVCETINNIFGRTTNPRSKNWSCGGSSGGEGAIVAFRGSVIGVGTDIAAFNFLYGLRPSHGRLPYAKMANSMEGQETIHSVCGPICHSIADMRLFVTSILSQKPWNYDSKVIPMPWRYDEENAIKEKISSRGLTLGYYSCDGNVLPHPPVLRAVQKVVDKLGEAGHTVIHWEPYRHTYAVDLASRIYASDGGTDIFSVLDTSGEPAIPNISDLVKPNLPKLNLNELWDIQLQKWNYQSNYLARIREAEEKLGKELDAIIAPITPTAAIQHDQFKYYGYATAINVLDFTSVVVPVTFVDKNIDKPNHQFKPLTEMDRMVQAEYDPSAYHGAPVAVQIIGRRLTEERVMNIAEEVGRLLGNEVEL
ncbi:amidase signature domain-containing protein [Fusarium venenatum]|uniref:amidase signature domain-containing protein n=1 Tax=Fusarium venenatum TaxID=56646 RepID=UPI001E042580|nr:amidase signature domain-containing protein [Fusarium venenatum]